MSPSTKDLKPSVPEPDEVAPATSAGRGPAASIVRVIAAILMIALAVGFFFVHHSRNEAEAPLIDETNKETQMPAVNVVTIAASSGSQSLRSPGETAAWNETVIYARVNGYVEKWFADTVSGLTIFTAASTPGASRYNPANTRRSMRVKVSRCGDLRRSTLS